MLERIEEIIDKVIENSGNSIEEVKAIGIGAPGHLDSKTGIIVAPPNLPFRDFNIVEPLAAKYGIPVYLENDANVAAIGEYVFGAGREQKNMVYVTVSTGIGGGAVINGKFYSGATSNALEVGHMTILPDGPKCGCEIMDVRRYCLLVQL